MHDASSGLLGDISVAQDLEGALLPVLLKVGEGGLVPPALELRTGKGVQHLVVLLLLEQRRQAGLHHDVHLAVRHILNVQVKCKLVKCKTKSTVRRTLTLTYSSCGWTQSAMLLGSVHGVVVHATRLTPSSSSSGNATVTAGSTTSL